MDCKNRRTDPSVCAESAVTGGLYSLRQYWYSPRQRLTIGFASVWVVHEVSSPHRKWLNAIDKAPKYYTLRLAMGGIVVQR
jgi:hypothetical protein